MLQASRLHLKEGQLITIAGASGGKRVTCSNQALAVYDELFELAENKGNYWAGMIVRGLRGLTSGRLSMDNVYIEKHNNNASGRGVFYLVLPGITAILEDCVDGTYQVHSLEADANYMQMQKDQKKPGLWRISNNPEIDPELLKDGSILKEKNRAVVIADPADNVVEEAKFAREDLKKVNSTIASIVKNSGFDHHHTPGDGNLVGLKPAKKAIATTADRELTESAILLANTMYKARNISGVLWFSHWGGSAVLTRALQILNHEKSIKLDKHSIFLDRPTSSSSKALALAKDLNMSVAEGGKRTGLRLREIKGNHLAALPGSSDIGKTSVLGLSAAGASLGVAGLLGLAAPVVGGVVTVMGAMHFVTKAAIGAKEKFSGKKYK